jgi:DNA-binding transcriptional regulator YiaG
MRKEEFVYLRKQLDKIQKEMAEVLGTSLKAVHSYEQGWRRISLRAERQILFLFSRKREKQKKDKIRSYSQLVVAK